MPSSSSGSNRERRRRAKKPVSSPAGGESRRGRRGRGGGRRNGTAAAAVAEEEEDGTKDRPVELLFDSDNSSHDDGGGGGEALGASEAREGTVVGRRNDDGGDDGDDGSVIAVVDGGGARSETTKEETAGTKGTTSEEEGTKKKKKEPKTTKKKRRRKKRKATTKKKRTKRRRSDDDARDASGDDGDASGDGGRSDVAGERRTRASPRRTKCAKNLRETSSSSSSSSSSDDEGDDDASGDDDDDDDDDDAWDESDAVTAVALRNYEAFNSLPRGSAAVEAVEATSAGIAGWAAANSVDGPPGGAPRERNRRQEVVAGPQRRPDDADGRSPPRETDKGRKPECPRSDEKEKRQLRLALLRSVGVDPGLAPPEEAAGSRGSSSDDAESYEYDDDDGGVVNDRGAPSDGGATAIAEPSAGATKASATATTTTTKTGSAIPMRWESIDEQLRAIGAEDGVAWATGGGGGEAALASATTASATSSLRGNDDDGVVGGAEGEGGVPSTLAATTACEDADRRQGSAEGTVVRPKSARSSDDVVVAADEGPRKRRSSPPPSEETTTPKATAPSVPAAASAAKTTTVSSASSRREGPVPTRPKKKKKKRARPTHGKRWSASTKPRKGARKKGEEENEAKEEEDAEAKAAEEGANLFSDSSDDYASLYWTVETDDIGREAEEPNSSDDCASLLGTIEADIGEAEERASSSAATATSAMTTLTRALPSPSPPSTKAPCVGTAAASATAASSSLSSTVSRRRQRSPSKETPRDDADDAGKDVVSSGKRKRRGADGNDNDDDESGSSSRGGDVGRTPRRRVKMRAGKSTGTWRPNPRNDADADVVGIDDGEGDVRNVAVPSSRGCESPKEVRDGKGGRNGVVALAREEGSAGRRGEADAGSSAAATTAASSSSSSSTVPRRRPNVSDEMPRNDDDDDGVASGKRKGRAAGDDDDESGSFPSSGDATPTRRRRVKRRAGKSTGTWPPSPHLARSTAAPHRRWIPSDDTTSNDIGTGGDTKNDAVPSSQRCERPKRVDDGEGGGVGVAREGSTGGGEGAESKSSSPPDVGSTRRYVKRRAGKSTGTWPPMPRNAADADDRNGKGDATNVAVPSSHGCESPEKVGDGNGGRVVVVAAPEASTNGGKGTDDVSSVPREKCATGAAAPREGRGKTRDKTRETTTVDRPEPEEADGTTRVGDGSDGTAVPSSRICESPQEVGDGGRGRGDIAREGSATGEEGADEISSSVPRDGSAALCEGRDETRTTLVTTIGGRRTPEEEDNDADPSLRRHGSPKMNDKGKGGGVVAREGLAGSGKGAVDAPPSVPREGCAESPKKIGDKGGNRSSDVAREGAMSGEEGADDASSSAARIRCAVAAAPRGGRVGTREALATAIGDRRGAKEAKDDDRTTSSRDNSDSMRSHCDDAQNSAVPSPRRCEKINVGEKEAHSIVGVVAHEGSTNGEKGAGDVSSVPHEKFAVAIPLSQRGESPNVDDEGACNVIDDDVRKSSREEREDREGAEKVSSVPREGRDKTRKTFSTTISGRRAETEKDDETASRRDGSDRDGRVARDVDDVEEKEAKEKNTSKSTNSEYRWMVPGMHLSVPDGLKRVLYDAVVLSMPEKSPSDGVWRVRIKWVIQGDWQYVDCSDCHPHEDFCAAAEANGDDGGGERRRRSSRRKRSRPDRWGDLKALPDRMPRGKVPYSSPRKGTCKGEARTPLSRSPKHVPMSSSVASAVAVQSRENESDVDGGGRDAEPPAERNNGRDESEASARKEGTVASNRRRSEEIERRVAADPSRRDETDEGGARRNRTVPVRSQQSKEIENRSFDAAHDDVDRSRRDPTDEGSVRASGDGSGGLHDRVSILEEELSRLRSVRSEDGGNNDNRAIDATVIPEDEEE